MSKVVSLNRKIDKLSQSSIVAAGDPVDEGAQAFTVPIIVDWEDGERTNAYLKCFSEKLPASLVNEVTGFLVGKACGLPLPRKMGFLELNESFYQPHNMLKWAVVVSELPGTSLKSIWKAKDRNSQVLKFLIDELFKWSSVENMLAFDDWMANSDRNIGNVIIRSPGSYSLIDHSDMPVRQCWDVNDLSDPHIQIPSCLGKAYRYPHGSGEDNKTRLRQFAASHSRVYNNVKDDLHFWWREALLLAGGQEFLDERFETLKGFFEARADASKDRVENNETLLKAS